MNTAKPGLYRHFKGGTVRVLYSATHSETLETLVVYEALYECRTHGKHSIWVRPMEMFLENVIVDGKTIPRFEYID